MNTDLSFLVKVQCPLSIPTVWTFQIVVLLTIYLTTISIVHKIFIQKTLLLSCFYKLFRVIIKNIQRPTISITTAWE
jgi:hypothetical protein